MSYEKNDRFGCEENEGREVFLNAKPEHHRYCNVDNSNALRKIRADIRKIREGLAEVCHGVKDVERGCICDGLLEILRGICEEEYGYEHLECDVKDLHPGPCFDMDDLEEGLCDIKDGIKKEKHGLAMLLECDYCEGIQEILVGVHQVEHGIKEVLCALEKFE